MFDIQPAALASWNLDCIFCLNPTIGLKPTEVNATISVNTSFLSWAMITEICISQRYIVWSILYYRVFKLRRGRVVSFSKTHVILLRWREFEKKKRFYFTICIEAKADQIPASPGTVCRRATGQGHPGNPSTRHRGGDGKPSAEKQTSAITPLACLFANMTYTHATLSLPVHILPL